MKTFTESWCRLCFKLKDGIVVLALWTILSALLVQNERFDDWNPTLNDLRKIFTHYDENIVGYHKHLQELYPSMKIPEARISSAEQGNFLEVLNMSLNTFENHYLNRNMDRTGQQSIVLTPGTPALDTFADLSRSQSHLHLEQVLVCSKLTGS